MISLVVKPVVKDESKNSKTLQLRLLHQSLISNNRITKHIALSKYIFLFLMIYLNNADISI